MKKLSLAASTLLISSPAMAVYGSAPCAFEIFESFLQFLGIS